MVRAQVRCTLESGILTAGICCATLFAAALYFGPLLTYRKWSQRLKINFRISAALVIGSILGGCATVNPSVPVGYTGPTATIKDSVQVNGGSKADFFYAASIDGKAIEESRGKTIQANYGHGMSMNPQLVERQVPVQAMKLELVGRTHHAAPIQSLTSTEYQVKGVISFTPEANKSYVVKGELGEKYSGVWLVEEGSGNVVGNKIEVNGSAALGVLEK